MKHILTAEDLLLNPFFAQRGLKAGDEIEIPNQNTADDADDTGGSNPPPDKERPDKP